jgi:putative hydrolase of HD superfamily
MVLTFIDDFPELDILRCIKLALLHDLVEIFAGDTYIFDIDRVKTKKKREEEALEKLEEVL